MIPVNRFAGMLVTRSATCFGILSYQLVQRLGRLVFVFQHLYSPYNITVWPSMQVIRIIDSYQLKDIILLNHQVLRMNIKKERAAISREN